MWRGIPDTTSSLARFNKRGSIGHPLPAGYRPAFALKKLMRGRGGGLFCGQIGPLGVQISLLIHDGHG